MATKLAHPPEGDRQGDLGRTLERVYQNRFSADHISQMRGVWRVLVRQFFQRRLRSDRLVLDVGAGHCLFINEVRAVRRIALDANPDVVKHAAPGVEALVVSDLSLKEIPDESVGHAFLSNFLEHLADYHTVLELLATIRRKLEPGGTLLILQPNFRLVPRRYFDFIDHQVILTDRSLVEALTVNGYEIRELRKRFLPLTSKSVLPKWPLAISLYLRLPPLQWLLAGQSFVVAARPTQRS
jgi:SAM-dependent methyltransferase